MMGEARTVRVWYRTTRTSLGYRGESAGCSFVAYRAGQKVGEAEAVMGDGMAELVLGGRPDLPVTVYLPEGMGPLVSGVAGVEEPMIPAPLQPRWLAYGDGVTQGWLASAPAMAWPAVAGRKLGLDVCNLGYAGTARGETTSAVMLAETPAEVVSVAFGLNNWSRVPHTMGLMAEEVRCFLSVVRDGHPDAPIVVVSPTVRPDAEDTPNRVGATLADIRVAMEETVLECIGEGDENLFLVEGLTVLDPEDLEDGIYPGDEGHRRIAAAVSKVLVPHLPHLQAAAEIRWAAGRTPSVEVPATPAVTLGTTVPSTSGPATTVPATTVAATVPATTVPATTVAATVPATTGDPVTASSAPPAEPVNPGTRYVAPPRFDVQGIGSLDPESLNDALFDALSPNGAPVNGSPVNGSPVNGSPVNGSPVNGAPVDGRPVDVAMPGVGSIDSELAELLSLEESKLDSVPVDASSVEASTVNDVDAPSPPSGASPPSVTSAPNPTDVIDSLYFDGASVETTPADKAPADKAPADKAPADKAPVDKAAAEGKSEPAGAEIKKPIPRDTTPVDIEIADMVVAALSLATNGADDIIMARPPVSGAVDELEWTQEAERNPSGELEWAEAADPSS
jgi:lysophospholipase L1-like esterase